MEIQIKIAKQNYFKNTNKTGRWLACKMKKQRQWKLLKLLSDGQEELMNMEKMKKIVERFYQTLYKSKEIDK